MNAASGGRRPGVWMKDCSSILEKNKKPFFSNVLQLIRGMYLHSSPQIPSLSTGPGISLASRSDLIWILISTSRYYFFLFLPVHPVWINSALSLVTAEEESVFMHGCCRNASFVRQMNHFYSKGNVSANSRERYTYWLHERTRSIIIRNCIIISDYTSAVCLTKIWP